MRAAPAFGRKKCERRCPFPARSQAARNIPSVAGRFIFAEATVRRAHHSPDGSKSRSAEATCGSFSIGHSGGEIASKSYMLPKMRDGQDVKVFLKITWHSQAKALRAG
jgi:hypothetical protein